MNDGLTLMAEALAEAHAKYADLFGQSIHMISLKSATIIGTIAAGLLVGFALYLNQISKPVYQILNQGNTYEIGISCPGNGGDPTVKGNYDGVLVVSCGNE